MSDPQVPRDVLTDWGLSASPKTVVVIDDDLDTVDLMVMVLESAGHTALGTTEGRVGLKLAIEHAAHVCRRRSQVDPPLE